MKKTATDLLKGVSAATSSSNNETQLRHELENRLESACGVLNIPWTPFQMDRSLKSGKNTKFVDVAHGAVIIEYEPPKSFGSPEYRVGFRLLTKRSEDPEF